MFVMSIYHEILGVPAPPKVIGMITLPDAPQKHKCICDDCGDVLNDSCGDPRNRVTTKWNDGRFEERWICDVCADEQFGDSSPYSIFG
jgi:hypothetical protein